MNAPSAGSPWTVRGAKDAPRNPPVCPGQGYGPSATGSGSETAVGTAPVAGRPSENCAPRWGKSFSVGVKAICSRGGELPVVTRYVAALWLIAAWVIDRTTVSRCA